MSDDDLLAAVEGYYTDKVRVHGATPKGVDWNDAESQASRHEQLLRVIRAGDEPVSVIDYGCGYGALLDTLAERFADDVTYQGFDVSASMVEAARERHGTGDRATFTTDEGALRPADFTVASGIFNVRLDVDDQRWDAYVLATLDRMVALSRKGIAFNALTAHADEPFKRADLHYADPARLLDHCLRSCARDVALHHDYELYEFTVVVRLDGRPPAIQYLGGAA
jgi:SAM-dependent methyltransferase